MIATYRAHVWVVMCLSIGITPAAHCASLPVEAFGRVPVMVDMALSPNGMRIAWIEDDGKSAKVVMHDLATHRKIRTLSTPASTALRSILWADDETLLINESETRHLAGTARDRNVTMEWQRWLAIDASGGQDRLLLMRDGGARELVSGAQLIRTHSAKPKTVYMASMDYSNARYREETGTRLSGKRKDDGWVYNLYAVDINDGTGLLVANGTQFTDRWLIDRDAKVIVRSEWVPLENRYRILAKDGAGWKQIFESKDCGEWSLINLIDGNAAVVALGTPCGSDRRQLLSIQIDGSGQKPLFDDPSADVDHAIEDPSNENLVGARLGGYEQPVHWIDSDFERRFTSLAHSFKGMRVHVADRSADFQRVIAYVEDASHAPIYYLVDFKEKKADILQEAYPQLAGVKLGAVREFHYDGRDQYPLLAYLTVPADTEEKLLPVVVLPHGGPESRDTPDFDWLAQFFSSRGYAVLQPQFRGSTGLGLAHRDAGRHQWGLRMQDDVTDGVRALIAQGIADPKRICIVGASYGGYAALAGAAYTPDLYTCAASIAGVSDLPTMLGYSFKSEGKEGDSVNYWNEHIGAPTDPIVIAHSPARSAAAVRIPILLLHGADDTVVPIIQSQLMERALKAANKPVEFVVLPGEDHWLSSSETRVRTLSELDRFLAKYLQLPSANAAN
jgi:dienelactone hydrolase